MCVSHVNATAFIQLEIVPRVLEDVNVGRNSHRQIATSAALAITIIQIASRASVSSTELKTYSVLSSTENVLAWITLVANTVKNVLMDFSSFQNALIVDAISKGLFPHRVTKKVETVPVKIIIQDLNAVNAGTDITHTPNVHTVIAILVEPRREFVIRKQASVFARKVMEENAATPASWDIMAILTVSLATAARLDLTAPLAVPRESVPVYRIMLDVLANSVILVITTILSANLVNVIMEQLGFPAIKKVDANVVRIMLVSIVICAKKDIIISQLVKIVTATRPVSSPSLLVVVQFQPVNYVNVKTV